MSAPAARPAAVALEGIAKKFGQFVALRGITLSIAPGEFVCFLGPSGCGKTTLLRIIAGLERQNAGVVMMGGRDVSALPAQPAQLRHRLPVLRALSESHGGPQRGLRARDAARWRRPEIEARVDELLALVGLAAHKQKYPAQLSGGEQQRIALARALAPVARAAAARRAALRARRARAPVAPPRDPRAAAAARRHHHHGDARSGGGAGHGRPHRGDEPRGGGAGGRARRGLHAPALAVRGALRGPDELPGRDRGRAGRVGPPRRGGGLRARSRRADRRRAPGSPWRSAPRRSRSAPRRARENRLVTRIRAIQFLGSFTRLGLALPGRRARARVRRGGHRVRRAWARRRAPSWRSRSAPEALRVFPAAG